MNSVHGDSLGHQGVLACSNIHVVRNCSAPAMLTGVSFFCVAKCKRLKDCLQRLIPGASQAR
eukprot:scaffold652680_cov76-Prasinocladus_malaysianus.AAC.1